MTKTTSGLQIQKESQIRYCGNGLPRKPFPAGRYLVHNNVRPVSTLGRNGFRAWTQKWSDNLVECHCDFGGCKNAELHKHYRPVTAYHPANQAG
jgi:hypothetical protein